MLGSSNLLLVKIEEPPELPSGRAMQAMLVHLLTFLGAGLEICGRSYRYLLHKVEHQIQDSKLLFVAVGASVMTTKPADASADSGSGTVGTLRRRVEFHTAILLLRGWQRTI